LKKEFIKDSSGALITHILVYMQGLFLMPVIIKTVGISVYGSFVLLASFVGIIYGLSALGVGAKSNRYLPSARTNEERATLFYPPFYFQLVMIAFYSIIVLIFEDKILAFISDYEVLFSIYIIPLYLILYSLYAHSSNYLRYTSRIQYMNIHGLAFAYGHISFVLFYAFYIGKIDINVLFLSQAFVALVVSLPFLILLLKELDFKFIFFKFSELKEQIKIGFPLVLNFIVDFILAASDRFVLAYFMGAFAVGLYVPAYALGSLILLVPKAIGTVVPQLMSKSVDSDNFAQAKSLFTNSIKIFMLVTVPFVFGVYLIGYEALVLLANEEVAKEGIYIATIVAVGSLFYGFNLLMSQANMVDLKTGVIFKANSIAAIFNLVSNIILLYFIQSIYVPAITTVVSFMIATVYFYKSLDEKWIDKSLLKMFLKIFIASTLMFGLIQISFALLPKIQVSLSITIKILLAIGVYAFLIITFKIYTKEQIQSIKGIFSR